MFSTHAIPINAIKLHDTVYRSDVDGVEYHLQLNAHASHYELCNRCTKEGNYVYMEVAIPLHDLKSVYAPWPNALVMGVTLKNGSVITLEVPDKKEAQALIEHMRAVIMLGQYCGERKTIEAR